MEFKDTYFFSFEEAYKVAKLENKKNDGYALQVCYYDGEYQESTLKNLVHCPIDNLISNLALGTFRLPTDVSFNGTNFSEDVQLQTTQSFVDCIKKANELRMEFNKFYIEDLKNKKLNFNEPLRFYLTSHANTKTMRYISENLTTALQGLGYEVCFELDYGCNDVLSSKILNEFNPHVTININHLNNHALSDEVFNFIWFQDFMPILMDTKTPINLRKRDIVFSLNKDIDILLNRKNIPFSRQHFCAKEELFYEEPSIERENKIVFIGHRGMGEIDNMPKDLIIEIKEAFENAEILDIERVKEFARKYHLDPFLIDSLIFPLVIRELAVEWMCEVSPIPVEVYGDDTWLDNPIVAKKFKGKLAYGDEVRVAYNSAKYFLVSQPKYLRNQRLFEGVACGCTPVVYDCRPYDDPPHYNDEILYFNSKAQMKTTLEEVKETKADPKNILNNNRYKDLAHKLIFMVKQLESRR